MKKSTRLVGLALVGVAAMLLPLSADASCGGPVFFGSYYSPVTGTTAGSSLRSSFWMVGGGNPTLGPGIDNGAIAESGVWLHPYQSIPLILQDSWSTVGYDGCPDSLGATASMAYALSDINGAGDLTYAVGCATRNGAAFIEFDMTRPVGCGDNGCATPIALVPAPKAAITGTLRVGNEAQVTVGSPDFSAGYYGDGSPGCAINTVIPQYDVYKQQIGRGVSPDTSTDVGTAWVLVGTGTIGSPFSFTTTCATTNCDVYVALAPHFNSNFSTGEPATGAPNRVTKRGPQPIQAGPTLAVTPKTRIIENKKIAQ
jgi:hypothetical protein